MNVWTKSIVALGLQIETTTQSVDISISLSLSLFLSLSLPPSLITEAFNVWERLDVRRESPTQFFELFNLT